LDQFATRTGGQLKFENVVQETPIQELGAYYVAGGAEPDETTLSYTVSVDADVAATYPSLDELTAFVKGRFAAGERTMVAALPAKAPSAPRKAETGPACRSPTS
jgi:hypothetical protein